ncbi:lactonase family protein [Micromonospora purpureochromogenes]|uniref:6-phosphogluconolactonase (Cycloisomerase 2 family) n=1 Tax=Micromonospora purpureochromogenes TaxID=47872 RepID=A0ABX2RHQ8_9ACTN|nr:lactonase family protein [Micromonospora purpureochromogenes]NYF54869.1 6-phosphogluconolactonase (cycloisomerase 2 family) [Micromonospora purpureochromogenes]
MTNTIVHIGGYTAASGGRGDGIIAARRDPDSGELTPLGTVAVTDSPSFLVRHPALPVLYAVNELPQGQVSAFRVGGDGELTPLGVRPTGGADPCHLAVAPDGRHLFVANYGGGSVAVFPLAADGAPAERSDLVVHQGHGLDPERQEQAHCHMVSPDPGAGPLLAVDLGTDSIYRYDLDADSGRLVPRSPRIRTAAGTGPRHLARHPDGRRCWVAGELDATVTAYESTPDGALHQRGRVDASGRAGHVQPSEIAVGPDGRFLYVGNRGVGTVSVFALDGELPRLVAEVDTGGEWPRHFVLTGPHLYLADERADMVRVFRVDPDSGAPEPLGEPVPVPSPTCVLP